MPRDQRQMLQRNLFGYALSFQIGGSGLAQHYCRPGIDELRYKSRPACRHRPKPRPLWNRWFPRLAKNSAVPIWRSSSEQGFFRSVLRVDHQRWGQTVADLRHLALSAAHPRSRERFLALHEIAAGGCATAVAERTGRRAQTV